MDKFIIYNTEDGQTNVKLYAKDGTVWFNQAQMAELFNRSRSVITKHINNIFQEGELEKESNVQKMNIAFSDKPVTIYSLDVILAVGFRVKSARGIQFRRWANSTLKEFWTEPIFQSNF